jgi:hypothetical protein
MSKASSTYGDRRVIACIPCTCSGGDCKKYLTIETMTRSLDGREEVVLRLPTSIVTLDACGRAEVCAALGNAAIERG